MEFDLHPLRSDMKMEYKYRSVFNSRWPEVIGKTAEEAKSIISTECPEVKIQVLSQVLLN